MEDLSEFESELFDGDLMDDIDDFETDFGTVEEGSVEAPAEEWPGNFFFFGLMKRVFM